MKRVEVTWVDSCSPERYWNWDVDGKADMITTVGYVARRDKKTISLVASIGRGGSKGGWMTIPRVAIKKIRKLK